MFCEDPATTPSDEFFGIFDAFVSGFHEAKMENDAVKRRREEEEKIAKQQQEVRLRTYLVVLGRSLKWRSHVWCLVLGFVN